MSGGSALRRAWGRLPASWRRRAHLTLDHFLRAVTPALMALVWRRGRGPGTPVTVAGFLSAGTGLGQGARLFVEATEAVGVSAGMIDITKAFQPSSDFEVVVRPPEPGGVLVSHFNPPELIRLLPRGLWRRLRGRRHVGYWAWELPEIPPSWRIAFAYVDEVWCPSEFTAEAVRRVAPPRVPVRVMAHPIFHTSRATADRARWGLDDEACVVLCAFDLKSTSARKNPWGAFEAYGRAVPEAGPHAVLICKVSGADREPALFAALQAETAARPDIRLIRARLSPPDMSQLIASADVILSLHRAEGFGLLLAEGMWLGKAVVATGWSGNMDFMDEDSAVLVPWAAAPVDDPQGLYAGGWWAEPDVEAAAAALRRLIADPRGRAELGLRARTHAERVFSREAWTAQFEAALTPAPRSA